MPVWCEADDFTLYVHTANVSRHGLFVRTSHPLPPETPFTVVFKELMAAAEVRVTWVRQGAGSAHSGMGLQITAFERGESSYAEFIGEQAGREAEFLPPYAGGREPD